MRLHLAFVALVVPALALGGPPAGTAAAQDRVCPDWTFEADGGPEGGVPTVYGCAGRGMNLAEIEITCSAVRYLPSVFPMEAGEPGAMPRVTITVEGGATATVAFRNEAIDGMLADETMLARIRDALRGGSDVLLHLADTPDAYADRFVARGFAATAEALAGAC